MRHDSLALTLAAAALGLGAIGAALSPVNMVGPVTAAARQAAEAEPLDDTGATRFDASLAMTGPNSYPMRYASGSTYTARIDRPNPYDTPFDAGYEAPSVHEDAASDQFDSAMADDHAPDDEDGSVAVSPDDVGDVVASGEVISPS